MKKHIMITFEMRNEQLHEKLYEIHIGIKLLLVAREMKNRNNNMDYDGYRLLQRIEVAKLFIS